MILAQHPRRPPLSRPSSHLPSHLSLFTVVHLLSVQLLTKCSSHNSFVLKTIHFDGGCTPLIGVLTFKPATASTCFRAVPFVLIFLRTLLHVPKAQLFCFQAIPNSLRKNTRVGGVPPASSRTADHDWLGHSARKCSALSRGA